MPLHQSIFPSRQRIKIDRGVHRLAIHQVVIPLVPFSFTLLDHARFIFAEVDANGWVCACYDHGVVFVIIGFKPKIRVYNRRQ